MPNLIDREAIIPEMERYEKEYLKDKTVYGGCAAAAVRRCIRAVKSAPRLKAKEAQNAETD